MFGALVEQLRPVLTTDLLTKTQDLLTNRRAATSEPMPEVLFAALRRHLDSELWTALRLMLQVEQANPVHRTLVRLMGHGLRLVITTNFDEGVERAARAVHAPLTVCDDIEAILASAKDGSLDAGGPGSGTLWKVHGSITGGREQSIAVTLDEIARENVDPRKTNAITDALRGCSILVMGYSGNDPDLASALIGAAPTARHLVWLFRDSNARTAGATRILEAWAGKDTVAYGDAEELLRTVASNLGVAVEEPASNVDCQEVNTQRQRALRVWAERLHAFDALGALATLSHYLGEFELALALGARRKRFQATTDLGPAWATLAEAELLRESARLDERDALIRRLVQESQTWRTIREAWPNEATQFRGYLYRHMGSMLARHDPEAARRAYDAGLVKARDVNDRGLERAILHDIGVLHARSRDFAAGREYFKRSAELARNAGDVRLSIRSAHELAICELELGDRHSAIVTLEENWALSQQHGDLAKEHATLFELVICLLRAARLSERDVTLCRAALLRGSVLGRYLKHQRARYGLAVYRAKFQLMLGRIRNARRLLSVLERHSSELNPQEAANSRYLTAVASKVSEGDAVIFLPTAEIAVEKRVP
jgi:tetratricopeptide (TPR) repeat protein